MRRLIRLAIAVAVVLGLGMGTGFIDPHNPTDAITRYLSVLSPASADAPPPTTDPVDAAHVQALLRTASVVPTMNEEPGYQRSCRKGKGCVFGPAWTDDSDAALSHNGCDTRNDILRSQLTHVQLDPKTRGCTVLSGVLDPDPYTGAVLQFRKGTTSSDIEIDHVFPLEAAWHAGAHNWPLAKRVSFANDPSNLLAADGSANSAKGSKPIAEWLPPNPDYVCTYIATYLRVAVNYQLPITTADQRTAQRHC